MRERRGLRHPASGCGRPRDHEAGGPVAVLPAGPCPPAPGPFAVQVEGGSAGEVFEGIVDGDRAGRIQGRVAALWGFVQSDEHEVPLLVLAGGREYIEGEGGEVWTPVLRAVEEVGPREGHVRTDRGFPPGFRAVKPLGRDLNRQSRCCDGDEQRKGDDDSGAEFHLNLFSQG
ncbi:hypothetical protein E2N92_03185 [Methanofollis formosanus]|uniref:Uncharacterized protein n=1 Tax=Methanofollis formosanus TaxID=299308 RepID=A0A8G1A0M4_9EURY|nr:hypothetical protein E2N92_03185 [Methanofollis formosanus]